MSDTHSTKPPEEALPVDDRPAPTPPTFNPVARTDGEIRSGKLAGKSMFASIILLSWPVLIEVLLNTLVGLVDTLVAASISIEVTDGVAAGTFALWLLLLVGMALGSGIFALVSRAVGKGRMAMANTVVGQAVMISAVIGVVFAFIGITFPATLASSLGAQGASLDDATAYLRLTAFGLPGLMMLSSGYACMRGVGESVLPMQINLLVNAINIVLSYLLSGANIFGITNPSPLEMGASGIGLATTTGWTIGGMVVLWKLKSGVSGLRIIPRRFAPDRSTLLRILRVSWPAMAEQ
ncbi:MAG: MATE family efflux transporter, partial [Planctomycetota bacterium]